LDRLRELSFEFDHAGRIMDCIGTIKPGGNVDHDYAGSGLARLYERARRRLTARPTTATILQFPNGESVEMISGKLQAPEMHQVSGATSNEQNDGLN
jgi:hypothetical protein